MVPDEFLLAVTVQNLRWMARHLKTDIEDILYPEKIQQRTTLHVFCNKTLFFCFRTGIGFTIKLAFEEHAAG